MAFFNGPKAVEKFTSFLISKNLTNTDTFDANLTTENSPRLWMTNYDFVDAPLVTLGVSGVVK